MIKSNHLSSSKNVFASMSLIYLSVNSISKWNENIVLISSHQSLDLSANQLSHIPADLPETLEYIYLQSNRISSVPASAFEGTPNIKGIFLR